MLRFRLLGPFEAFRDDERIPANAFRTVQARCALKLLISEHDRPVPFTRLTDTFWPDADPGTARNSLHVAVRTLRRVLEPGLERGAASRFVVTTGEAYRFVPNDAIIDVDAFLDRRRAGLGAEQRHDASAAIDAYRAAMPLYRGEYIAEEPDAEWVLGTRERLREAFLDIAGRLALLLASAGHTTEAVAVIERALVADPVRDDLYLRLMTVHAQAGRRAHALATFERCRRVARAELGVEPGPELVRLRAEVVSGAALPATTVPEERSVLTRATAFVGREGELAALDATWQRAATEPGHLAFMTGDAGAGKTRLARQFTERLGSDGQCLWLSAHELERDLGFGPLLTSFGSWLDGAATTRQVERLGPHGPALASVLPQVRVVWPDCPPAEAPPERGQILEAMTVAVRIRTGRGRALMVLDDAQNADVDTLHWLGYALHRLPPGVLVLVIGRSGEGRTSELDALRAEAQRRDRLTRVDVGPLTTWDVERLVDDATEGSAHAATLARRLHATTKGNALFVVETIRDLSRADVGDGAALPIAPSVRDAILARTGALPDRARDVLGAMAVLGAPAPAGLIASVAGSPAEDVIDALDVLLARRLVQADGDANDYAIEHPFVSRVVYGSIGPARRQERHRRAATALAAAGDAMEAQLALRHLGAAGRARAINDLTAGLAPQALAQEPNPAV